jgi:hypoxanthine phosphoribosyltransferase
MTKRYISWEEIETLVNTLHDNILESGKEFDTIWGLPRGELISAVMLSHKLDLPYKLGYGTDYGNALVIDDICDSGKTLKPIEHSTAVLHYKPHTSIVEPTFYANKFTSDDWIVYPWENKDSKPIQDYRVMVGKN